MSQAEIRRLATLCGWTTIYQPELTVTATDCGGNVGFATMTFRAGLKLLPGIGGP